MARVPRSSVANCCAANHRTGLPITDVPECVWVAGRVVAHDHEILDREEVRGERQAHHGIVGTTTADPDLLGRFWRVSPSPATRGHFRRVPGLDLSLSD